MSDFTKKEKDKEISYLANNGVNVTKNLEGRFNTTSRNIWIRLEGEKPDFLSLSRDYMASMIIYVAELTKRAYLDKEIYEKLLDDLLILREKGYRASLKPQSYFYQGGKGFVFVDPEKKTNKSDLSDKVLIRCAFNAVFGNGLPEYYVEYESHNLVPENLQNALKRAEELCLLRLMEIFMEKGFDYSLVFDTLNSCRAELKKEVSVLDESAFCTEMKEFYSTVLNKEANKGPNLHFTKEE